MKPGDYREVNFYVKNSGDIGASTLTLSFGVEDVENGKLTDAESLVDNTTDRGELSGNIIITKFEVTKGDQTYTLDQYTGKTLEDINGQPIPLLKEPLEPGKNLRSPLALNLKKMREMNVKLI